MRFGVIVCMLIMAGTGARAQQRTPLLREKDVARLADELSGETAKRNLEGLARLHRQRGSAGFHAAAELVAERARAYGLSDVAILQLPADGKVFYGTQRSRPGWDAELGELSEVRDSKEIEELKRQGTPYVVTCDNHGEKDEIEEGGVYRGGEWILFGEAYQRRYAKGAFARTHQVALRAQACPFCGAVTPVRIAQ